MLPADHHLHTPLCHHATGEPTEYAAHAAALGLPEIGFSDHAPMRQDNFDNWRMNTGQLEDYVARVERARRDHPGLGIRLGLEVDYIPGQEEWIRELSARHPWDYFIGSVHYLAGDWAIDDPSQLSKWREHDPFEVWSIYFHTLAQAAGSRLFDIIGHADLPKKFGIRPRQDCTPLYEQFLQAAQAAQVAIELNTAGLRKDCREIYPARPLLELAHQRQIPIAFGSDAHAPGEVGMDFSAAVQLARSVGYRETVRFHARQRRTVPFD
ncbi:MAG: histidinol-phosphatase HisJ family protein [Verrucomicrobia bacterium]|nr:histidinol-phosphatase HisJ family protein [Verrucomicrobiota bacterium]